MYGLSPTSVVRFEKSGDVVASSFVFVTSCISACWLFSVLFDVSCSPICFPKSIFHDTAYHSLCDTLTSGSGRYSFARTVTSGTRCSGT